MLLAMRPTGVKTHALDASRRVSYENIKARKTYKESFAKERRRQSQKEKAGGLMTPKDIGEEMPPFFAPIRTKLYMKCVQEFRNSNRFTRKPMPKQVKEEYARRSKEYF